MNMDVRVNQQIRNQNYGGEMLLKMTFRGRYEFGEEAQVNGFVEGQLRVPTPNTENHGRSGQRE